MNACATASSTGKSACRFEIIWRAEFRDLEPLVPEDEKLERVYYEAMKKAGEFKATETDKKNLDARVEKEFNDTAADKRKKDAGLARLQTGRGKSPARAAQEGPRGNPQLL